jgi:hypothetical protein
MRLRLVYRANFQRSEATNYASAVAENKLALGKDDVVCLVSLKGDQLVFVWKPLQIEDGARGRERHIVSSQRLRLTGGVWNPLMLANYAERVGLQLDGLRKFEQIMSDLKATAPLKAE